MKSSCGSKMFDLQGKTAVVTGAGSGIGAAIAQLFARQGAIISAVDRDGSAAAATVRTIVAEGGTASAGTCDVSNAGEVDALFDSLSAGGARVDILVNNAGIAHIGTIEQTTPDDFDRLYRVNVFGVYLCARAAVP